MAFHGLAAQSCGLILAKKMFGWLLLIVCGKQMLALLSELKKLAPAVFVS